MKQYLVIHAWLALARSLQRWPRLWHVVAWIVSRKPIASILIWHAFKPKNALPSIYSRDGYDLYMRRGWVFNPFANNSARFGRRYDHPELPSIRVHHIMRPDQDRDEHNHPWDARTIVLRNHYVEMRGFDVHLREQGNTAEIKARDFHRITYVPPGGVFTLFFTWPWQRDWGFNTETGFVPWREYLGVPEGEEA